MWSFVVKDMAASLFLNNFRGHKKVAKQGLSVLFATKSVFPNLLVFESTYYQPLSKDLTFYIIIQLAYRSPVTYISVLQFLTLRFWPIKYFWGPLAECLGSTCDPQSSGWEPLIQGQTLAS